MTGYLLDTNTASYVIKGFSAVQKRLTQVPMAQVAVSAITEGELRYGVTRRPDPARLKTLVDEFLLRVAILPWDSQAAQHYGQIRATLEHKGQLLGNLDMLIGAHARAMGFVLVTSDRAFKRIENLKVENWMVS